MVVELQSAIIYFSDHSSTSWIHFSRYMLI